ncbi:MAG: DinB family protein [Planctomycetota bacterium]|nr:DinB family protein [Planctomycetota bacterium]
MADAGVILVESIAAQWRETADYARRLVADLRDEEMVSQPVAGVRMNHPAWILSHLSAYGPVLAGCLRGEAVEDPIDHRFGRNSAPVDDAAAYLPKQRLIDHFVEVYDDATEALRAAPAERLAAATPIERWIPRFPRVGDMPVQFLIRHNATHLGQLSAWRRAGGRPAV